MNILHILYVIFVFCFGLVFGSLANFSMIEDIFSFSSFGKSTAMNVRMIILRYGKEVGVLFEMLLNEPACDFLAGPLF